MQVKSAISRRRKEGEMGVAVQWVWRFSQARWRSSRYLLYGIVLIVNSNISSVQFSPTVVSDFWWPHGLQHARLPCPSPTLGAYSNSCPLSQWCDPTISSSVVLFSSHLQSFPASGSFPMSQFFTSGGQILEFQLQHQSFQWIFRTDSF